MEDFTQMRNRTLIKELRDFLIDKDSPNRNALIDIFREHIDKQEKSIALCFRGSYATFYYRCRMLLKLEFKNGEVVGSYDFNYAKARPDRETIRNTLVGLGVTVTDSVKKPKCIMILSGKNRIFHDKLKEAIYIFIELIDGFKKLKKENDRQQQLYGRCFGNETVTYYDIEYTEPFETLLACGYYDQVGTTFEDKRKAHRDHSAGKFDLLGIRRSENGYVLQLAELKSTIKACTQRKAGVKAHFDDYTRYCKTPSLLNLRKIEAINAIALLSEILDEKHFADDIDIDSLTTEIVFIFTDESVQVVDDYRALLESENIKIICYDENMNVIE